jgi:hypothetical protein
MDTYLASRAAGATFRAAKQDALEASVRLATADKVTGGTLDPDSLAAIAAIFPRWQPGLDVKTGEVYRHDGQLVECIQPHTTQADWTPDTTPTLWNIHRTDDGTGPVAWQPGIALQVGEQVTYDGTIYTVTQGHTTQNGWEPPAVPALFAPA